MLESEVLSTLKSILALASTREEKARHVADAICASGPYRWVGIYDVNLAKGTVSNIAWSGAGAGTPDVSGHERSHFESNQDEKDGQCQRGYE